MRDSIPIVRRDDYSDPLETLSHVFEAMAEVEADWIRFRDAKTMGAEMHAFISLSNSISDLATWHPDYNIETGEIELGDDDE